MYAMLDGVNMYDFVCVSGMDNCAGLLYFDRFMGT